MPCRNGVLIRCRGDLREDCHIFFSEILCTGILVSKKIIFYLKIFYLIKFQKKAPFIYRSLGLLSHGARFRDRDEERETGRNRREVTDFP
jgi:hypothetical protein